jgi:ABC-2 type transport system permease protein
MGNILTITGRELKAYFLSPFAWVIIALFAAFTGFVFVFQVIGFTRVADLSPVFEIFVVVALFLTPALTMRLFSEEYKLGTIELLLTAPARDWEIVVGKFLAAWLGFAALLVSTLWLVVILLRYGNPDLGILGSSYLGLLLLGAAFVSIGMFASSVTQNQFIAFMLGMISFLFLWFADAPFNAFGPSDAISDFFRYLALPAHFQDFFTGVIDMQHVLYFVSLAGLGIVWTTLVVQSRRWR